MFNNIFIIGCGLIGSSLLRAIKKNKLAITTGVYDKSKEVLNYIKKENLSDNVFTNINDGCEEADLIIISAPLSSYKEILLSIKDNLKKDVIITDTGSAKKEVNKIIENLDLKETFWIGSHPIAGTEDSGPKAGFAELFKNRWCILSSSLDEEQDEFKKIKKFWEVIGSKVKIMSFEKHDHILSLTSHLPHAIAFNLVRTAIKNGDDSKDDVIEYSAGGLRDFTRIAASDPIMWRDIFIDNSENILKVLDSFTINLEELKKAIKNKNGNELFQIFSSTKEVRKKIIKAGQDTEMPNFGRKKN